jgi:hypothetical protein
MRAVVEAKDAENAVLRAEPTAERELRRDLELKVAAAKKRFPQACGVPEVCLACELQRWVRPCQGQP